MSTATQRDESFTIAQRAYDAQEPPFTEAFTGDAMDVEVRVELEEAKTVLFLASCGLGLPSALICWALAWTKAQESDRNKFDGIAAELDTVLTCNLMFHGDLQIDDGRAYKFRVHRVQDLDSSSDLGTEVLLDQHGGDEALKMLGEWVCEHINEQDLIDEITEGGVS